MADGTGPRNYTDNLAEIREGLAEIREGVAILNERSQHTAYRLDSVDARLAEIAHARDDDLRAISDLQTRAALIEDKQSRSNWILGALQALTMGVLGFLGARHS